jgi:hypothetical protein
MHLGTGYDLWARIVDKTLTTDMLDNFFMVVDEAKKNQLNLHQTTDPAEPSSLFSLMTILNLLIISRSSFYPICPYRATSKQWLH